MTSNSHNENRNLLRICKLALFHWYPHLGAPVCNVSFKNSAQGKAMGNTNTATGGHYPPFLLKRVLNPTCTWQNNLKADHVM